MPDLFDPDAAAVTAATCEGFLRTQLSAGPVSPLKLIWVAAVKLKKPIELDDLLAAADRLGVVKTREGWVLPKQPGGAES